mgnify:CR=1 FL=1
MHSDTVPMAELVTAWQHARIQLQQHPDSKRLMILSQQLCQYRLRHAPAEQLELTTPAALPDALWRGELLFSLSSWLNWPQTTTQLLLSASYCCGLSELLPEAKALPKLQPYPPLLSARLLQTVAPAALQQLLSGCYATERKIPSWRQPAASLLLTLVARLTTPSPNISFSMQLENRIVRSRCEHELAMIRKIVQWLTQAELSTRVTAETLLSSSAYQQLRHSSNKVLAATLSATPAWREPVLQLATELNRQQQQITDLPLAVNLIGRDLLDSVLIDAELNNQLSLLHHPQHAMLQQLTASFACCLHLLTNGSLTVAKSRALARCLCAPLWFDSSGYRLSLLRQEPLGYTPLPDFSLYQKAAAAALIRKLLQQYHLTDWLAAAEKLLAILQKQPSPPDTATQQLLIAWYSCQALFTAVIPTALPKLLQQHANGAVHDADAMLWLTTVAEQANSHCPLLLTL